MNVKICKAFERLSNAFEPINALVLVSKDSFLDK